MIAKMIREGAIVPGHITIELLRKAIYNHPNSKSATFKHANRPHLVRHVKH